MLQEIPSPAISRISTLHLHHGRMSQQAKGKTLIYAYTWIYDMSSEIVIDLINLLQRIGLGER